MQKYYPHIFITFIVLCILFFVGDAVFHFTPVEYFPSMRWTHGPTSSAPFAKEMPKLAPPSRDAYDGCSWEQVTGAGLSFWGMRCNAMHMVTFANPTTATLVEETASGTQRMYDYVRVYDLPHGKLDDLFSVFKKSPEWKDSDHCAFLPDAKGSTPDVARYTLMPTGKAFQEFQSRGEEEPINTTCGGYGAGNDGILYWEVHKSNPKKALFLQLGQDAALVDEQTIVVQ